MVEPRRRMRIFSFTSYSRSGDDAGADGAAALADRKPQPSSIAIGVIQLHHQLVLSPAHHLLPFGQVARRHVGSSK